MATRNFSDYDKTKVPNAENMCFGIVVSERTPEITDALLEGAVTALEGFEALPENIHVKRVPGTMELVYGAHQMTLNDGYDAVIALGCVVKGKTHSFDCVVNSVTAGFAQLNVTSAVPVIFGVLATETMEDARERAGGALGNKGEECAVAAIKMAKF